jgi:Ni/Fe-hydrogenase subunit HybB-like protein
MTDQEWLEVNRRAADRVPNLWVPLQVFVAAGAVMFLLILIIWGSRFAWQAYWVNFLFWMGLAQAGVVLAALVHLTKGRWGGALVRLGLLEAAFLPVTLVLYVGIIVGARSVLPWVQEPVPEKAWWLSYGFFVARNGIALLVMSAASLAFAYYTLRPEAGALVEAGATGYPKWLIRGWRGVERERERSMRILAYLAPWLVFIFTIVYSLLGFDMVMSLAPHWYSNLFGAYFFITTMYMGLAALVILATVFRRQLEVEEHFQSQQFHDVGKLLFAFCLLSTDFLWSQFLVIWYGDLPEENLFILHRVRDWPWSWFSRFVLFGGFVIPFIVLLNRRVKQIPLTLSIVAAVIVVVGFAERLLMVVPSVVPKPGPLFPFRPLEGAITLAFAALYVMALLWALRTLPLVPRATPQFGH